MDLVQKWIRLDYKRLLLGKITGFLASSISFGFGMWICFYNGQEPLFIGKLLGAILLGPHATELNNGLWSAAIGFFIYTSIHGFWSIVFAHFVISDKFLDQFWLGLVWAFLNWVFTWNLFAQSFLVIRSANIPSFVALAISVVYGLSLTILGRLSKFFKSKSITARR